MLLAAAALSSCYRVAPVDDRADGRGSLFSTDNDPWAAGETATGSGGDSGGMGETDVGGDTAVATDSVVDNISDEEWILIRGGTFEMGSEDGRDNERPVHGVTVGDFEMMRAEVTAGEFEACVDAGACGVEGGWEDNAAWPTNTYGSGRDDHPMNSVDWDAAGEYCKWAGGRLPTEAEWEYAARSQGQDRDFPWGDEAPTCDNNVMAGDWVVDAEGCGEQTTWPVCSKPLGNTDQGVCDMAGSVAEWVADLFHENYEGAPTDGSDWGSGNGYRVLRGGTWKIADPYFLRVTSRYRTDPWNWYDYLGFRCVRSPLRR